MRAQVMLFALEDPSPLENAMLTARMRPGKGDKVQGAQYPNFVDGRRK